MRQARKAVAKSQREAPMAERGMLGTYFQR
jgi:hypothetical protein